MSLPSPVSSSNRIFLAPWTALGRELNSVVRQFVSVLNQISCQPVHNLTSEILLSATVNKLLDFDDDGTAMRLMTMMNNIVDALREPLDMQYILYNYLKSRSEFYMHEDWLETILSEDFFPAEQNG